MLTNYIKIAFRNLWKHKSFSAINISGLAIGIASCALILLYVFNELSYDRFHNKRERIFRVVTDTKEPGSGNIGKLSTNGWPIARILRTEYPDFERVISMDVWTAKFKQDGEYVFEPALFADDGFFDIFTFPMLKGEPTTALRDPNTAVISQSFEKKYFHSESALGKTLILEDMPNLTVTGVMKDMPEQSHFQAGIIVSFATYPKFNPGYNDREGWFNLNKFNYVLLKEGESRIEVEKKIENIYMSHAANVFKASGYTLWVRLQPLQDIYLDSEYGNRMGASGSAKTVHVLLFVALIIILIAAINFMNLSTARSMLRGKEVGIRKAIGSTRKSLIVQFLAESSCTAAIAFLIGLMLAEMSIASFNDLVGTRLSLSSLWSTVGLGYSLLFLLIVGLISGSYPAFALSGFKPVEVLKGRIISSPTSKRLRQYLVIGQFAISCFLINATMMILKQLRYMREQELGFTKEQVLVINAKTTPWEIRSSQSGTIKKEIMNYPGVASVSAATAFPGRSGWRGQIAFPEGGAKNASVTIEFLPVDYDFARTIGLRLMAGRDFSPSFGTDAQHAMIINETAVRAMGWKSPQDALGKKLATSGVDGIIIGVVKDYHQHGLQEQIGPIGLALTPPQQYYFAVRLNGGDATTVVAHVESVWKKFFPGYSLSYRFLDEEFDKQYRTEQQVTTIFGIFAGLAIFIACLGLFGLAAFTAERRTKEIGVRKVLGASIMEVVRLLSKDFLKLVLAGFTIAVPVSYWAINEWISGYAYRTTIGADIFFLTGLAVLGISFITISYQSIRAALANPVETLRYE